MTTTVQLPRKPVQHHPVGLSADGAALGDGAARDALRQAMRHLSDADLVQGSHRAPALCQALTEAARALAGLHAYGPAESHLAQAQCRSAARSWPPICTAQRRAWAR